MQQIVKYMQQDSVSQKLQQILGSNKGTFVSSALQAVSDNRLLQNATPQSVYGAVMASAVMKMPINNNLGYAYIVPYNRSFKEDGKWVKVQEAQLQLGYKGFIQLAIRTNQYETINVIEVHENQYAGKDLMSGEVKLNDVEPEGEIIGYVAYFKLLSGYRKWLYMTKEEANQHGIKYSKSYKPDEKDNKSLWTTDFDSMAKKTVLKLLLSKFGPLSIEMQAAMKYDQAIIAEDEEPEYPDNPANETPEEKKENLKKVIESGEQESIPLP